jgi:RNA polymerase sigma-70 factor (ECF subfamily)
MCVQKKSDQQLVSAFISGDTLAIEYLILRYKDKIFSFIISKVRDEDIANDIFQDTFIKVINTLRAGRYNEEGKFISWTMRIAHNLVIDHFRKTARVRMVRPNDDFDIFDVISDVAPSAESDMVRSQVFEDLRNLITYLSVEQKQVLEMRYYAGMSFKDIAEQCDISINTALGRMRYAIINLRKLQQKHQLNLSL